MCLAIRALLGHVIVFVSGKFRVRAEKMYCLPKPSWGRFSRSQCCLCAKRQLQKTHFVDELLAIRSSQNQSLSNGSSPKMYTVQRETVMNVFDRKAKCHQRDRAAMAENVEVYDYLKDEVAYRLVDRLRDITRTFPVAADIGCGRGHIAKHLSKDLIGKLYQCEMSSKMLEQAPEPDGIETVKIRVDEENLSFETDFFDLILSSLSLHWVNDLPGTFQKIHHCLKRDGPFIGAMFGGDTLFELRCSLQMAEIEREGGFSPRISPFTDVRDLGNLLTRAGFSMLTVDVEDITVNYPSMFELMSDLKGMAENNAAWSRKILHRGTMMAASAKYKEMYGNADGSVPATFQVLYMIGWKPDNSQARPADRGSANVSFKDLDKLKPSK